MNDYHKPKHTQPDDAKLEANTDNTKKLIEQTDKKITASKRSIRFFKKIKERTF